MGSLEFAPPYPCCGNFTFHMHGNPKREEYKRLEGRQMTAMRLTTKRASVTRIGRVDPGPLQIRETLRRLDMRLRPVRSSPAELDAMLAEFHGVKG